MCYWLKFAKRVKGQTETNRISFRFLELIRVIFSLACTLLITWCVGLSILLLGYTFTLVSFDWTLKLINFLLHGS